MDTMKTTYSGLIAALAVAVPVGPIAAQTFVRVRDDLLIRRDSLRPASPGEGVGGNAGDPDPVCDVSVRASHGQIAPDTGGGTFSLGAFFNPATLNASGTFAFFSQASGALRNQGIFTADDSGAVHAIAVGCGGGGGSGIPGAGCGDPSPIGGTFSGFFSGTIFAPAINDVGDVLFLADVAGGTAPRGLFLYSAATQAITRIAAVGDPSPIGGTFGAVGPGSMNNTGGIVFLAAPIGTTNSNIFMWNGGVISKVAAIGDPAPGGGTFSLLGTESFGFQDGTNIPGGPAPDINDSGQIAFRAIVSGGVTTRGLIVRTAGVDQWYVTVPDPTPAGGTYFDMQAAAINNAGQIAFFADYRPTPTTFNSGWFAGAPGSWRTVLAFFDPVDGGQCLGLAFSRNPMQTIDGSGNVLLWTDLNSNGGVDRLVIGLADGDLFIAARRGDPTPNGGTIGSMQPWPSILACRGTLSAATPGGGGGALSAHMAFTRCRVGDVDGDCTVGIIDLLALLAAWGPCPEPCPPSCAADDDGDCAVGIVDLLALLASWA